MTAPATAARRHDDGTPDAHLFPTRPYDLVKEFVLALVAVLVLTLALAWIFSSPDEKAVTMADWATNAPADVVATATGELAGTTTSAGYGAPYNTKGDGQSLGPLPLQRWAGVQIPVDSAQDLVLTPLGRVQGRRGADRGAERLLRGHARPAVGVEHRLRRGTDRGTRR